MTMDPLNGTAMEIAALVAGGAISARDVTRRAIDRISAIDERVNAFTDVTVERALAEADIVDARVARGERPPLAGVPYAVKNLFDLEGVTTRAGSRINRENAPATRDAFLVRRMAEAGAICLGALNMGEYAYDFTGRNAHDGHCRNPHDLDRMAGGSSSGSGAAVAAGMVALSLGSDTNGSIRVPASFCGLFGLKPTYGRLSRGGTFPFTHSLDHLGPLARSARDLALAFDLLQGLDPEDPHQRPQDSLPTLSRLNEGVGDLRIAIAGGYFRGQGFGHADAAVDKVAAALGVADEVEIPAAGRGRAAAFLITNAESAALHLSRLRTRAGDFDPETRDRFLAGALLPATWYLEAQRFRSVYRAGLAALFEQVDVLLAPATPVAAPGVDQMTIEVAGHTVPARANIGVFTQPISFAGLPVVSVPVWVEGETLPIGVQVIAAPWREDVALRVAAALEQRGAADAPIALMAE